MPWFQSKPKRVHAEQFTDKNAPPRGVHKFTVAETGYATFFVVTAQERKVSVVVGEWIVDEGDGEHFYPIADEIFTGPKGYDLINEPIEPTDFERARAIGTVIRPA